TSFSRDWSSDVCSSDLPRCAASSLTRTTTDGPRGHEYGVALGSVQGGAPGFTTRGPALVLGASTRPCGVCSATDRLSDVRNAEGRDPGESGSRPSAFAGCGAAPGA